MASLRQILQQTHHKLESYDIPDARLEAEVALMNVLQIPRQAIFSQQESEVTPKQEVSLNEIIQRREQREPLAYILGYREFYDTSTGTQTAVLESVYGMAAGVAGNLIRIVNT